MAKPKDRTVATTEKSRPATEKLLHKLDQIVDEMSPSEVDAAHERVHELLTKARASHGQNRETA